MGFRSFCLSLFLTCLLSLSLTHSHTHTHTLGLIVSWQMRTASLPLPVHDDWHRARCSGSLRTCSVSVLRTRFKFLDDASRLRSGEDASKGRRERGGKKKKRRNFVKCTERRHFKSRLRDRVVAVANWNEGPACPAAAH